MNNIDTVTIKFELYEIRSLHCLQKVHAFCNRIFYILWLRRRYKICPHNAVWNDLHQVNSKSEDWKVKWFKSLWYQEHQRTKWL